ncbi:amidohydrolase family protein [Arthrobacter sp. 35W]|uniref:amidohydrolase family protein n=1 Tax=Arthrobacter sp. 35W TaxID=1132441 RepID=UPI00042A2DCB|nr:amidohydrolase family protein [Arthrobacter sp. 35W]
MSQLIDAHTHVWPRWPYDPPVPDDATRGSYGQLLATMDAAGVDKAIVVNARITHSADNNHYGAQAVAQHPDRFEHFVDFDGRWSPEYHAPGSTQRLRRLIETFRPAGVSHYLAPENDGWLLSKAGAEFFAAAGGAGLIVNFACSPLWHEDLRKAAREFPEATIMVNHLAGMTLWPGGVRDAARLVVSDEDLPNLLVKISGFHYGTPRPWAYPHPEALEVSKMLYESLGPDRLVWGSDWPSLLPHMSYRQSLEIVREEASFLSAEDLPKILGGNLHRALESARPRREGAR